MVTLAGTRLIMCTKPQQTAEMNSSYSKHFLPGNPSRQMRGYGANALRNPSQLWRSTREHLVEGVRSAKSLLRLCSPRDGIKIRITSTSNCFLFVQSCHGGPNCTWQSRVSKMQKDSPLSSLFSKIFLGLQYSSMIRTPVCCLSLIFNQFFMKCCCAGSGLMGPSQMTSPKILGFLTTSLPLVPITHNFPFLGVGQPLPRSWCHLWIAPLPEFINFSYQTTFYWNGKPISARFLFLPVAAILHMTSFTLTHG